MRKDRSEGFEFARSESRHEVHRATKPNFMKFSERLLKRTFEEIAPRIRRSTLTTSSSTTVLTS